MEIKSSKNERSTTTVWLVCFLVLVLLGIVLGWFDNTTELVPHHDFANQLIFCIALVSGAVFSGVGIYLSRGLADWRRIAFALLFLFIGVISGFVLSYDIADIVEGVIDFPQNTTRSYTAQLLISRAYQTHGKGRSWNIQTTPIWSNLEITEEDYNFMLANRRPGDESHDPGEIKSKGYFCAQVTMQQSGNAMRVMNAGTHKLPKGTVIRCPSE
jgi:hypothetical protein